MTITDEIIYGNYATSAATNSEARKSYIAAYELSVSKLALSVSSVEQSVDRFAEHMNEWNKKIQDGENELDKN